MFSGKPPSPFDSAAFSKALLAERRVAPRFGVIKSAKLLVGEGYAQGVYDCLVLDESDTGALVDLGTVVNLHEEMVLQVAGGAQRRARRCWAVGSKAGLEFFGAPLRSSEVARGMQEVARLIESKGLAAGMIALRGLAFFDEPALREAALQAEAACAKLSDLLKG